MPPRSWDWWTEQKLDILAAYLSAFTTASKKAGQTVYLDLFAGRPDNVSRDREQRIIRGSARLALESQPPITHLRLFELASQAAALKQRLAAEYPGRTADFEVVPGDCNATIASALASLADLNWAPTFAFLDQQSTEVHWTTIEALARHKRPDKWKTELWILCANGLLPRGLRLKADEFDQSVADAMTRMFGTAIWLEALDGRRQGLLTGAQFREELTNLMRYRLEHDLNYRTTLDFQVTNTRGSEIFNMIFATDHPAGEKIMTDIYRSALHRQPDLRLKAQLKAKQKKLDDAGTIGLFDLTEVAPSAPAASPGYQVNPISDRPHEPYRLPSATIQDAQSPEH